MPGSCLKGAASSWSCKYLRCLPLPVLDVSPTSLHQRIGLVFGSRNEVERIERYHREPVQTEEHNPLFAERSLFRF